MTRRTTAALALGLIAALVGLDTIGSAPPNLYRAPPLLALGSGQAAVGAHCAALPTAK